MWSWHSNIIFLFSIVVSTLMHISCMFNIYMLNWNRIARQTGKHCKFLGMLIWTLKIKLLYRGSKKALRLKEIQSNWVTFQDFSHPDVFCSEKQNQKAYTTNRKYSWQSDICSGCTINWYLKSFKIQKSQFIVKKITHFEYFPHATLNEFSI